MKRYVAKYGDYLAKIAEDHGTTVSAIWNHPANAEHRAKRSGPDSLYPGDVLMIPVPASPSVPPPEPVVPPPPPKPPELPSPDLSVMRPLVIRQGDYVDKLALLHRFDAEQVWHAPPNQPLRQQRKPDILHPGDVLYIPLLPALSHAIELQTTNNFVASVPVTDIHLRFEHDGAPLAREAYELQGLRPPYDEPGDTDGYGAATITVPVHVPSFELYFPRLEATYELNVGHMDPVDKFSGVMKRLRSLGCAYVPPREALDVWREADLETVQRHELLNYQKKRGLPCTGELDLATREALVTDYGC